VRLGAKPDLLGQQRERQTRLGWLTPVKKSEAQRSGEKKSLKKHLMLWWAVLCGSKAPPDASRRCHQDGRKEVEASLHIKDAINQSPCFSETIVMSITPPSIH